MPNINKVKPKNNSTDRFNKITNSSSSVKDAKSGKNSIPKKAAANVPKEGKCCSAGALSSYVKTPINRPKKTTKSEVCCTHKKGSKPTTVIDYCITCGDAIHGNGTQQERSVKNSGDANIIHVISEVSTKDKLKPSPSKQSTAKKGIRNKTLSSQKIPPTIKIKEFSENTKPYRQFLRKSKEKKDFKPPATEQTVKEFYRNEKFAISSQSIQDINKLKKVPFLDTINEQPESSDDGDSIFKIYDDDSDASYSGDIEGGTDGDDYDSIKKLREFRDDNYFECHSSQSRLKSKGSVTSLTHHKCIYRFYLNDRLFPVPVNSDHQKTIRCMECQLPLDLKNGDPKNINGTIQAKVKLREGDDAQDMVLMLPVQEPLIIKQNKKPKDDEEVVYFGVIKLDAYGGSLFTKTQPPDSLALKYQKGYKEYRLVPTYEYQKSEECEVIVI